VESGQRKSKESWGMILRDLRTRGLKPWRCTIAAGHLGVWAALREQYPALAEQRCGTHQITSVLDALPKQHQPEAHTLLCAIPSAETRAAYQVLRAEFTTRYRKLASKVAEAPFRRLTGAALLSAVQTGQRYLDGLPQITSLPQQVAA
jgi:putative transposase